MAFTVSGETRWVRTNTGLDGRWEHDVEVCAPHCSLEIPPQALAANYGCQLFEGLAARWTADGRIVVFRPLMNSARMRRGAERLGMVPVPEELFLNMVEQVIRENRNMIPSYGNGSLYIRPVLLASGARIKLSHPHLKVEDANRAGLM